jgi:hypothetical protein
MNLVHMKCFWVSGKFVAVRVYPDICLLSILASNRYTIVDGKYLQSSDNT